MMNFKLASANKWFPKIFRLLMITKSYKILMTAKTEAYKTNHYKFVKFHRNGRTKEIDHPLIRNQIMTFII
jgi:hypothetical protein